MPKIDYKLASQGLKVGGASGGLSPVSFNGRVGNRISAPRINVHAADTGYTPMPVPKIQKDAVDAALAGAANLSDVLTKRSLQYQEAEDQYYADKAVLDFTNYTSKAFYGTEDEKGLASTIGEEGVQASKAYAKNINETFASAISSLTPAQKQKAALRLNSLKNSALERGAKYQAQQVRVRDDDLRYQENMAIRKAINDNPTEPWTNGVIATHISKYQTQKDRNSNLRALAAFTIKDSYDKSYTKNGDTLEAYKKAEGAKNLVEGVLDPDSKMAINDMLMTLKNKAYTQEEREAKENLKKIQYASDENAPIYATNAIVSGDDVAFKNVIQGVRKVYENDPQKGSKKVVEATKSAIFNIANDPANITLNAKKGAAEEAYKAILSTKTQTFSESVALEEYILTELPKALEKRQEANDSRAIAKYSAIMEEQFNRGKELTASLPPNDMLADNIEIWNNLYTDTVALREEGLTVEAQSARLGFSKVMQAKFLDGSLSDLDMRWVNKMAKDGAIGTKEYKEAALLIGSKKSSRGAKLPHQNTATYKQGISYIKNMKSMYAFMIGVDKPKSGKKLNSVKRLQEKSDYEYANETAYAEMVVEFDKAAKEAGPDFNAKEWADNYMIQNVYGGNTDSSFWEQWFLSSKTAWKAVTNVMGM